MSSRQPIPGVHLRSTFQSIFSVSHGKVVGHEALLRGEDDRGTELTPGELFPQLVARYSAHDVNELCTRLHLGSFARQAREGWLFLNVSPDAVRDRSDVIERFGSYFRDAALDAHRIVVEIVETRSYDERQLADAVEGFRDLGCLVAIDDFGAGESNFERVWRLRPDLVKLDRAMLEEATDNPLVRHVLPGLVSLVHEIGCLVVLEGIETAEQAHIALEADVDFVQGFYFSRPTLTPPSLPSMRDKFAELASRVRSSMSSRTESDRGFIGAYLGGFEACAASLEDGSGLADACALFLAVSGVQRLYLLNAEGIQLTENLESPDVLSAADRRYDPCATGVGADWYRRPYFQRALAAPRVVQVSRPYLSIRDARCCVTLSIAFERDGELLVLCADIDFEDSRPLSRRFPQKSGVVLR